MSRLDDIRRRATKATPGPWAWFGNTDVQNIYLATVDRGRQFIMQFRRWGFRGAQPQFQHERRMTDAHEFARFEVAPSVIGTSHPEASKLHRRDFVGVAHPDAEFIAHARADIDDLLAVVDRVKTTAARVAFGSAQLPTAHELAQSVLDDLAPLFAEGGEGR